MKNTLFAVLFFLMAMVVNAHTAKISGLISNDTVAPNIQMKAPVLQDTIYSTGPFDVFAYIKDSSGIDTAYITYQVNGALILSTPMVYVSDSTWRGTLPGLTYGNRVDYSVHAIDGSGFMNEANGPAQWFFILKRTHLQLGQGILTSDNYGPISYSTAHPTYDYSRYFYIYRSNELIAAGLPEGARINRLEWNKTDANYTLGPGKVEIYMNNSNKAVLYDSWQWQDLAPGATMVFRDTTLLFNNHPGWKTFPIDPFVWTGSTLDLGVMWDIHNVVGTPVTGTIMWQYTSGLPGNYALGSLSNGNSAYLWVANGGTNRPNLRMYFTEDPHFHDAGLTALVNPMGLCTANADLPVSVVMKNYGDDTLRKVTLQWTLDGIPQTPFVWSGSLTEDVSTSAFTIGNINTIPGSHELRVWSTLPNDSADSDISNDNLSATLNFCDTALMGTYSIGPTGDFSSFSRAGNVLMNCGVSGSVIFTVQNGNYREQLILGSIPGASSTNTITFQSQSGNPADVLLNYDSCSGAHPSIVQLTASKYVSIRNITIQNFALLNKGNVILMGSGSCNNQVEGCVLRGKPTTNISTSMAVVFSEGTIDCDTGNVFRNNHILYGSYGVNWSGTYYPTSMWEAGNCFEGNLIENAYSNGMLLSYQNNLVVGSNIVLSDNTVAGYSGIYVLNSIGRYRVTNNQIQATQGYGLRVSSSKGLIGQLGLITNNAVLVKGSGANWGLYAGWLSETLLAHNTVRTSSTNGLSYAFYSEGNTACVHLRILNNCFAYDGIYAGGMAAYTATNITFERMNYNDLYSAGTNLAYRGSNFENLSAWQIATGLDSNSVSELPVFLSDTDFHTLSSCVNGKGTPLTMVPLDIDSETRNGSAPDIGADEFTPLNIDLWVRDVILPSNGCGYSNAEPVSIRLVNFGTDTLRNAELYYSLNEAPAVHETFNGSIPYDSVQTYTFTQPIDLSVTGIYSLKVWGFLSGDSHRANDTVVHIFYSGFDFSSGDYTMGFEANEDLSYWSVLNPNGDIETWLLPNNNYPHTGVSCTRFNNYTTAESDDWLLSRCFTLEAGRTYEIEFWLRMDSPTNPQALELRAGMDNTADGMTELLLNLSGLTIPVYSKTTTRFEAPASGSWYFGFHSITGSASSYGFFMDDINISLVPEQDVCLLEVNSPRSGCGLGTTAAVQYSLINTGSAMISGNLQACFQVNGAGQVCENITTTMTPGDTIIYNFSSLPDLSSGTEDTSYNFNAWVQLLNDGDLQNDSLSLQVESYHIPSPPVTTGDTIAYGANAFLHTQSVEPVYWYADSNSALPFFTGSDFTTAPLFDTTTYYVSAITGTSSLKFTEIMFDPERTGATDPMPAWLPANVENAIEISNLGGAPCLLEGIRFVLYGYGARTFAFPKATLLPGEVFTLALGTGTDNPAHHFYFSGGTSNPFEYASASGFVLEDTAGNILDALPVNYYIFNAGTTGVTTADWSGYAVSTSNCAGIILIKTDQDTVSDWIWSHDFIINQTIGELNPMLNIEGEGCISERVPVTTLVNMPQTDLEVSEIISPQDGCTFGAEIISIRITNHGSATVSDPFDLGYQISGTAGFVSETVNYILPPEGSVLHTFTTPAPALINSGAQLFQITAFAELSGDAYWLNDTLVKEVLLHKTPQSPLVSDATVSPGDEAILLASSADSLYWFNTSTGGLPIAFGQSFTTPTLYNNTTFFVEACTVEPGYIDAVGTSAEINYTVPFFGLFDYGWSSFIYTRDELEFAGLIDSIGFYISNQTTSDFSNQRIYMKMVPQENFTDGMRPDVADMTLVFNGDYEMNYVLGWNKIALQSSFRYDRSGSLLIMWENYSNVESNSYPKFQSSETPVCRAKYDYHMNYMPVSQGNLSALRPNIWLSHDAIECASHRIPVNALISGQSAIDAGVTSISGPGPQTGFGSKPVKTIIQNFGQNTLNSVTINWSVGGALQPVFHWTGTLPTGGTDTLTIGNYNFGYIPYPGQVGISAWTTSPNAGTDNMINNDTTTTYINVRQPLSGTYYIHTAAPDFNSFTQAVHALTDWGVSGPVLILAETGVYNEQLRFPMIPGASALNTVTFKSLSGNNEDVVLQYAAVNDTDNYVVQLNATDHLAFESLTIKSVSQTTFGNVIDLCSSADSNRFENNSIESITALGGASAAINSLSSQLHSFNQFIGNRIMHGNYGIYMRYYYYGGIAGDQFINNEITGWRTSGICIDGGSSLLIKGNTIENGVGSVTVNSVWLVNSNNKCYITGNRIHLNINNNQSASYSGIFVDGEGNASTNRSVISNNFISHYGGSGQIIPLYILNAKYYNIYNNSINIENTPAGSSTCLYISSTSSHMNIVNNSFVNNSGGVAFDVRSSASVDTTDYNNFYSPGTEFRWNGSLVQDITQLQGVSGKDAHSISVQPAYLSTTDLHLMSVDLYHTGIPIASVSTDIDGESRNTSNPCIGADEFTVATVDAGIISIDAPSSPVNAGAQDVRVSLRNFGLDTLTSVTINYQVNGLAGTPFLWSGSIATGNVEPSILIGSALFNPPTSFITAWTCAPNGLTDTLPANDSASINLITCNGPMAGTYTIGSGTGQFHTFSEATLSLSLCGINGPVVFNVQTGTYEEQVKIHEVNGASAINTVTFQSASGLNTDVILQYPAVGSADNYVLWIDSADYITFRDLSMHSTTIASYGNVVILSGGACYNTFTGNIIRSVHNASGSAQCVSTVAGLPNSYNRFDNNLIEFGGTGIRFIGSGVVKDSSNKFIHNSIFGFYSAGITCDNNDFPIISDNIIENEVNSIWSIHVSLYNCGHGLIEKNQINGTGDGLFEGITIYQNTGSSTYPTKIYNNFVNKTQCVNYSTGIFSNNSQSVNIFNNTVNISGYGVSVPQTLRIFSGADIRVQNNILVNTCKGYAYYVTAPVTSVVQSDYNNIYSDSLSGIYWGTVINDLSALQTISGMDVHSVSLNPFFLSSSNLHIENPLINGAGSAISGITEDIDGEIRNTVTPDIGADEFTPALIDAAITAFVIPDTLFTMPGRNVYVSVNISNHGTDTLTAVDVYYKYGSSSSVHDLWTGVLLPGSVEEFSFALPFTVIEGRLDLCAYSGLAGDANHSNDTLCINYAGVPIIAIPYSTDFESSNIFNGLGEYALWEFGAPDTASLAAAHSPVNAWKTNLNGNYYANASEYLYTPYFDFSGRNNATIEFWHWYETNSGYDGGHVEYSVNGNTWLVLGSTNDTSGTNWYNSTISGSKYFSGNPTSWVHSSYNLTGIPGIFLSGYPVQFRFKFMSQSISSCYCYRGWVIDDFAINTVTNKDVSISAILSPGLNTISGDSIPVQVQVNNYGNYTTTSIPLAYSINGVEISNVIWTGSLAPSSFFVYTFPQKYLSPVSGYDLCAYTTLPDDQDSLNDAYCFEPTGTVGTEEFVKMEFALWQNDPNPASGSTQIRYMIPNRGEVKFELRDVVGQLIYTNTDQAEAGLQVISIDVHPFSKGLYFYSIDYEGKRLAKKLIVN